MQELDIAIKQELNDRLRHLEEEFDSDVIFYYGEIDPAYEKWFRDFIEKLKSEKIEHKCISIILNTSGGSAETVEKMVNIIRFHYREVYFIVPDYAMSAGTIFCMSGDKIFMDYSSSLGPIDPQVFNGSQYVPALGYLDKVNDLIEKAKEGTLTTAEFAILQTQDLAMLKSYEQARDLTVSLLKEWLVKYKFKNWTTHRTDPKKKGKPVTLEEKEMRAKQIAEALGNNKRWLSHGRTINVDTLINEIRLEIEDYSNDKKRRDMIRQYNDLICQYIKEKNFQTFLHSKCFF